LETNCRNLDTCHSEAVAAYDSHVDKTRTLVEKWNVETAALHKILCYCNVWLAEKDDCDNRSKHNATQFDVCKDETYSPKSVDYGTPAAKVACLLTSVVNHPGTSGFVTQEYDSFTGFTDSVVPCAEAPAAFIVHEGVGWCSSNLDELMWGGTVSELGNKTADECWTDCQASFGAGEPRHEFWNDGEETWCYCQDGCPCMSDVGQSSSLAPPDWVPPSVCAGGK